MFKINPQLLAQLNLADCQESTAEATALRVYVKLCDLLKYDEGYFYRKRRHHPNDDPLRSLDVVGLVTAETPVTCYNFSRIAVTLLNRIDGVTAEIVKEGTNGSHYRFNIMTRRMILHAEAINTIGCYNDLARVKLGKMPQGLTVVHGKNFFNQVMQTTIEPKLKMEKSAVYNYLKDLRATLSQSDPKIHLPSFLSDLRAFNVDGSTALQLLGEINRQFTPRPYRLERIGEVANNGIVPQLLIHDEKQIAKVNLLNLSVTSMLENELNQSIADGHLIKPEIRRTQQTREIK